ncbi:methyltransferase [Taklimakanibacter lacteus]|uniref:methyltransferase n=1 Tax=Taklimakanibacter lacteus TaxID=2268456 RepID=UPI0013C4809E
MAASRRVAKAYDFSKLTTIIDMCGANGNMLAVLLSLHPHLKGILADLESPC